MRRILVGECSAERIYQLSDPDASSESEFEYSVARMLSCVYPTYQCVIFGGSFQYDDRIYKPDLALVAKDFSHWFIIEVELVSHSLDVHVLPQVRAFRYGTLGDDCISILSRQLNVSIEQAKTLVDRVPRTVVVIANKRDHKWEIALGAHNIQLLAVSSFRSINGVYAVEIDGTLEVVEESLGFGIYSATDRSIRFPATAKFPLGLVQIDDPLGSLSSWAITRDTRHTWITKESGAPDILDGSHVQIIRSVVGRLSLRRAR
jgi:hypothetical protein